jgi:DNA-binding PadR family transcriptional regulator
MLRYLVLGLLRDGAPRHGYAIRKEYRQRAGLDPSTGPFYRELARLLQEGLIRETPNPPGSDPRRTPYAITPKGTAMFDAWLRGRPVTTHEHRGDELCCKVLFLGHAPRDVVRTILDGWQEELWVRGSTLEQAREVANARRSAGGPFDPLSLLIKRRLKQVVVDLELIEELRAAHDALADSTRNWSQSPRAAS